MSRMTWNAPEERFFDTGLDRGVLYPKKPAVDGEITAVNLLTNPNFTTNASGWSANNGTITRVAELGDWVLNYAATNATITPNSNQIYSHFVPASPGEKFFAEVSLKLQVQASNYKIAIVYYNGATFLSSSEGTALSTSLSGVAYTTFSVLGTAPANTTQVRVAITAVSGINVGNGFRVDRVLLARSHKAVPYFDGNSPADGYYTYGWNGTTNASTSYRRERFSSAVAWNGLTSVDEQGGDGAAEYYIDGRPYLYLPRPKEFKATLNAYTYPDEFSEIMGVAEVADGMYLDSQLGDSFDLCYRTLVGNQLEGIDHGYKIHLVYNATVTPQSLTYDSLGNSINPTTFSWDIQAVPVRVDGFRPTAHIIIDTRHMDPAKIEAVEALIYGDEKTIAAMPTPQAIFDLLSYGGAIIVIDNGDGTFTVEGSYENVYMIGPDEFRIDNVDGTNNADGTFTISSTGV